MRHHAGKEDIFPRYVQRFQEVVLPRPAAGRRHTIAGAISADKDEQRIGTLPHNLRGSLQHLRESAIRFKVARDKGDDWRTASPEHTSVRKPDRRCRIRSKPRCIDTLVAYRNAPLGVGGVQTSLPMGGADASLNGLTVWMPGALYIPQSTAYLDAAKKFAAFVASPAGCDALTSAGGATGPYLINGCTLPADVPPAVSDLLPYFAEGGQNGPALEFLSPIKGPALEQITVEVGSGIRSAADAAKLYDEDVRKQAKQLGLPNW